MFSILRPYIFSLDPEVAHDLAIKSLKVNILPKSLFDVEGEELNVLKSVNFKNYKPRLISVEIHNKDFMYDDNYEYLKSNKVYKFVLSLKYKLIWQNKYSFIFENSRIIKR